MREKPHIIDSIVEELELPSSAYEQAKERYESLGEWLGDPTLSRCANFHPKVFSQGSFRLGTAIKPLASEHYDLDISCSMTSSVTHQSISQHDLKKILEDDLEQYRASNSITTPIASKRRCLRLVYRDDLSFHIDIVPSIPARAQTHRRIKTMLMDSAATPEFAESVANHAVSITDCERLPQFYIVTDDWLLSNPEGYALWFDEQSRKATGHLEKRILTEDGIMSKVEDLPSYKWNSPLQQVVKLFKRHRDVMFKDNEEGKPISIILTTLTALAYEGEDNLALAIRNILLKFEGLVSAQSPRIPNPVNNREDFTDKWGTEEGIKLGLEDNFWLWLKKVKRDFEVMESSENVTVLTDSIRSAYSVVPTAPAVSSQIQTNKLLAKAKLVGAGAMTSSAGVIGSTGIKNQRHQFYGYAEIDKTKK